VSLLDPASGAVLSSLALDAPCLASPVLANGRLLALSSAGTLHAFQGANVPPDVSALAPDAAEFDDTPPTLSWTPSEPGCSFVVRLDDDGEILLDWDYEWTHADGACGPWRTAVFGQDVPPLAPASFAGVGKHRRVVLSWTASASPDVVAYELAYGPSGGPIGPWTDLGLVLSAVVGGLTNGTAYEFRLRALDSTGDYSTPVAVTVSPVSGIWIGNVPYDLVEDAVAAATGGQVIRIGEETFDIGATLVLAPRVHLEGVNAHVSRLHGTGAFPLVEAQGNNTIRLLCLSDAAVGVLASGTGVVVRNVVIRDMSDAGIDVPSGGSADVLNATLVRNAAAGARSAGQARVRNSIVQQNGVGLSGAVESSYNDVSDGYAGTQAGTGDLAVPVLFVDAAADDFREQALQPSLDAGRPSDDFRLEPMENGGRINMGAFGNTELAALSPGPAPAPPPPPPACTAAAASPAGSRISLLALALLLAAVRRGRR
jgi:hypothetical protein